MAMVEIDPTKVKVRETYPCAGTFFALAHDSATGRLYAGGDDGTVQVFDRAVEKKEPVARWRKHENYIAALVCLPGSKPRVVSGGFDRRLIWWDPATGEPLRSVEAHDGWMRALIATPG